MELRWIKWLALVIGAGVLCAPAFTQSAQSKPAAVPLLWVLQKHQGSMVAEESCAIVFAGGKYRSETFRRRRTVATIGFEEDSLDVKEGQVSEAALNGLSSLLSGPEFRELTSPKLVRRIVDENYDALQIMVFRNGQLQQLKYPNKNSRKGHEQQLKPLLDWWQELRRSPGEPVKNAQKTRCTP